MSGIFKLVKRFLFPYDWDKWKDWETLFIKNVEDLLFDSDSKHEGKREEMEDTERQIGGWDGRLLDRRLDMKVFDRSLSLLFLISDPTISERITVHTYLLLTSTLAQLFSDHKFSGPKNSV